MPMAPSLRYLTASATHPPKRWGNLLHAVVRHAPVYLQSTHDDFKSKIRTDCRNRNAQ